MPLISRRPLLPATLAALALAAAIALPASALTFGITFDGTADGTITPPILGTGLFSFDGDPGDGSFPIDSLTDPQFSTSFSGDTFMLSDTEDDLSEVLAVIGTEGPNRVLRFGNINGNSGGVTNGAFDLFNDLNQVVTDLSFQPGVSGGDLYGATDLFGTYRAIAVPEPAAATLLILATMAAGTRRSTCR